MYYNKKKILRRLLVFLILTAALTGCRKSDGGSSYVSEQSGTIGDLQLTIDGKTYTKKQNLESYLLMGTDASGKAAFVGDNDHNGTGQVDFLDVLVIDKAADTYRVLRINRNTNCEVRTVDAEGNDYGTSECQISYAHAHGDGLELSCESTVEAVETLFPGLEIDGYACLQTDTIGMVNHYVGGVTVTIEDDFSDCDPSLKMGETIKLTDEQAEHFVRGRMNVADTTNVNRMGRQQQYLDALKPILMEKTKADESYPLDLYEYLQDYIVTNLTNKDISRIAKAYLKDEDLGYVEVTGQDGEDDRGITIFYPDQESIQEVLLELLYNAP